MSACRLSFGVAFMIMLHISLVSSERPDVVPLQPHFHATVSSSKEIIGLSQDHHWQGAWKGRASSLQKDAAGPEKVQVGVKHVRKTIGAREQTRSKLMAQMGALMQRRSWSSGPGRGQQPRPSSSSDGLSELIEEVAIRGMDASGLMLGDIKHGNSFDVAELEPAVRTTQAAIIAQKPLDDDEKTMLNVLKLFILLIHVAAGGPIPKENQPEMLRLEFALMQVSKPFMSGTKAEPEGADPLTPEGIVERTKELVGDLLTAYQQHVTGASAKTPTQWQALGEMVQGMITEIEKFKHNPESKYEACETILFQMLVLAGPPDSDDRKTLVTLLEKDPQLQLDFLGVLEAIDRFEKGQHKDGGPGNSATQGG